MRIALTYNLRNEETEAQAELDSVETIEALLGALRSQGHEATGVEVTCSLAEAGGRIAAVRPDLVFHFAAGIRGKMREAAFAVLYEDLGVPYTGSDGWTLCVSLDKALAKMIVGRAGVPVAAGRLVRPGDAAEGLPLPCLLKPCYQSSSMGISDASVVTEAEELSGKLGAALRDWPEGILAEAYIRGTDVTVPWIAGLGPEVLTPCSYDVQPEHRSRYGLYDYRLKHEASHGLRVACPAEVPDEVLAKVREYTKICVRELRLLDYARVDFRVREDGEIFFIEANAMPALEDGASLFDAAKREGFGYAEVLDHIARHAARRWSAPAK